jgi:histidine ammonia-lyase
MAGDLESELRSLEAALLDPEVRASPERVAALLAAAQGIDFRRPLRSSDALEDAHRVVRRVAPHLEGDRYLALDIEAVTPLVRDGIFVRFCPGLRPEDAGTP